MGEKNQYVMQQIYFDERSLSEYFIYLSFCIFTSSSSHHPRHLKSFYPLPSLVSQCLSSTLQLIWDTDPVDFSVPLQYSTGSDLSGSNDATTDHNQEIVCISVSICVPISLSLTLYHALLLLLPPLPELQIFDGGDKLDPKWY